MNEKNNNELSLNRLSDQDLLSHTKRLVENERKCLTEILHHLREVEKRKLFSDLGYKSLFEYAVKEQTTRSSHKDPKSRNNTSTTKQRRIWVFEIASN